MTTQHQDGLPARTEDGETPSILEILGKGLKESDLIDAHFRDALARQRQIESEPLPVNIVQVLDDVVADVPDQTAWHFFEDGVCETYRQIHDNVNRLAHGLHKLGIRKGSHVAVMIAGNVPAFPTTWLALGRLGAVMVPVNDRYSSRELDYILNDSDAEWLVIDMQLLPCLEGMQERPAVLSDQRVITVGESDGDKPYHCHADIMAGGDAAFVYDDPPGPEDIMNIQYTSGTTGFPKGCLLRHSYWTGTAKVAARRDGLVYKNILASTPYYYMDPQWLTLMAFYQRGTLFVARRQSSSRFMEWVRRYDIHFCLFNEMFYRQPPHPEDRNNALRRVNIYGLRKEIHRDLQDRFNVQAREAFGMTEIGASMFMPLEAVEMIGSGSCGMPCAFRECKVVDEQGNEVPNGEIGELVVRGPNILLGYYNKPEATRDAFFGEWFRTGDLFRRDARGFFYIVGRIKDMIRRNSENISAREVESVAAQAPGVRDVAAVPVPHETRGEDVKIYVIAEQADAPPRAEDVIAFCEKTLAPFKVPRYVEFVEKFPRTPSGKISKNVLKAAKPDLREGSWDGEEKRQR
ncbi:AMP-binding protein [Thalassospiraceae bacterium LMO-JJ14]|nr:AMP-binding protein [Thalassospiraceae bacterium LMO-JJ14]